jgi:hypothetical protein
MDIPKILPGGETLWMDSEFMKMLHEGKPEIGWIGDPSLGVYYGNGCMEIRRPDQHGNMKHVIMRSRPGLKSLGVEALVFLAEHDSQSRKKYDVVEDVNTSNARAQARLDTLRADSRGDAADRLAHALMKDVGHLEGGSTRRFFPGIDIPKPKGK